MTLGEFIMTFLSDNQKVTIIDCTDGFNYCLVEGCRPCDTYLGPPYITEDCDKIVTGIIAGERFDGLYIYVRDKEGSDE